MDYSRQTMAKIDLTEWRILIAGKRPRRRRVHLYQVRRVLTGLLAALVAGSVSAQTFLLPAAGEDVIGQVKVVTARYENTLSDIARAYHVGYEEIVRANPQVDPWLPGRGTRVIVPMQHILPQAPRRGLVLIDPSYEDKEDYRKVVAAMRDALQRFATGVYAVWYPQVQRQESQDLPGQLKQLAEGDWLHASLTVKAPAKDGLGLHGSGLFIFNPPWNLEASLQGVMPVLVRLLGQDAKATFKLKFKQT